MVDIVALSPCNCRTGINGCEGCSVRSQLPARARLACRVVRREAFAARKKELLSQPGRH